jgi:hypothetical protein
MAVSTRLPGIQFDVVAPPAVEALVRMDIAVFIGFATSGPLQTPVAVEDIAHFEEIFGNDLSIANDPSSNQPVYALLPSSVRAFFRNGGTRCWVIRVADTLALSNRFPIPGLFELQGNAMVQTYVQAYARARSEGSWSDAVAVGTALGSLTVQVVSFAGDPLSITLLLGSLDDVVAGDLLKFSFGDSGNVLWLFVDTVTPATQPSPPISGSRGRLVTVTGQNMYWQISSPPFAGGLPVCERLTMDLFVQSDTQVWSLTDLGFAPAHPRYWAGLPVDVDLYNTDAPQGLWLEAAHPRFPLAGEDAQGYYLPFDMGVLPQNPNGPDLADAADAIVRDGVSAFGSDLFLDPSLSDSSTIDLLQEANYICYQSPQPRTLTGIHAALAVDEATIIAVPDAVQRGWTATASTPLAAPSPSSPLAHPEWWHFLDCDQKQNIPLVPVPPAGQFEPCDLLIIDPPTLQLAVVAAGMFTLSWPPLAGAVDYLEEALDSEFLTAGVIYQGSTGSYTIYNRPAGDYYYRVRRQIGDITSNYSNGVGIRLEGESDWAVDPVTQYQDDTLLAVHSALLRMCAARGDMFAVLAMPQHYRDTQAMSHAAELKSALDGAEENSYSFGALYHPWLIGREEDDLLNLRANPPDGAMAGIFAMRSSQRGPWISPANEPLHGVVDMTPAIPRSSRQGLQDSLVNLIRQEPGGFLCLCELTLSDDPDLSPINVRRLLSFLRKTVARDGVDYVFEPNSDEFRRHVERGFETLLDSLLVRGAFAGRVASEAFQVVTDNSVNTAQAMDNGQFFIELRVAPSVPMRFLTIRLLQTADRTYVTEGGS